MHPSLFSLPSVLEIYCSTIIFSHTRASEILVLLFWTQVFLLQKLSFRSHVNDKSFLFRSFIMQHLMIFMPCVFNSLPIHLFLHPFQTEQQQHSREKTISFVNSHSYFVKQFCLHIHTLQLAQSSIVRESPCTVDHRAEITLHHTITHCSTTVL